MAKRRDKRSLAKRGMSLEACAARMTAFLASPPRSAKTRAYLETLPKRKERLIVGVGDYDPIPPAITDASRLSQALAELPQQPHGIPPSLPSKRRDRVRPRMREKSEEPLMEIIGSIQRGRCILCGSLLDFEALYTTGDPRRPSFDHVVPRSRGGANVGNRLVAHRFCNSEKSNRMPTGCELVWLAAVNARLGGR